MKGKVLAGVLFALSLFFPQLTDAQEVFSTRDFSLPEMKWRPIPLWFWNNTTIVGDELEKQLEQMVKTDYYGGCAILPFGEGFRPGYLSDDYFTLYSRAIETARRLGAHMSIYDEYGFPSGSMGAINGSGVTTFKNNHPEHTVKRLDKTEFTASGGTTFFRKITLTGKLMSLVAWNKTSNEIVNLRQNLSPDNQLTWEVPGEGTWRVMAFQCVTDGDPNVDYLSSEAVSLFIKDTHEAYYSHFPESFGQTVVSTFFDEPTMYRAQGRMWTNDFNEKFEAQYGFSPETLYPALWYNIGSATAGARNLLFGMHTELYARGFMGTIGSWAEEHGILATGHQDQEEIANPTSVAGDLMKVGKYMSMPGIDKIGGGRPTENFYKVVSSSANNWDKDYVMSETYGAMGNIPFETMYQVAIDQYTKGINHLIPHAVWYNDKNVTFLPELSWRNSLYKAGLPRFNRFLSRLNYILARPGRHVADVAVLYPIETLYAGHYLDGPKGYYEGGVEVPGTDYPVVSHLLTDELGVDFTYLHPEVLNERCSVEEGRLVLNNKMNREAFSTLILPGVKTISLHNMKMIEAAWRAGMTIIFTTQKPSVCADLNGDNEEIRKIVEAMLAGDENCGKAFFVAQPSAVNLRKVLQQSPVPADLTFSKVAQPFNYIHKIIQGYDVYLIGNIDASATTNTISLRSPLQHAMLLNPHTGECAEAQLTEGEDGRQLLELSLRPNQCMFLVDANLVKQDGTQEEVIDKPLSYSIEAKVRIEKLSGSICFAGTDDNSYCMWQFNVSEAAKPRLRPHRWLGGSVTVLGEVTLPKEAGIQRNVIFNVRLEVENEQYVKTYINDVLVDEREGSFPYGRFGFRQAHDDTYGSEETARFDDVKVTVNGTKVFDEDFSGTNPFSAGNISSGWLRVQGSMSRDILAWIKELPDLLTSVTIPYHSVTTSQLWSLSGRPLTTVPRNEVYIQNGRKQLR